MESQAFTLMLVKIGVVSSQAIIGRKHLATPVHACRFAAVHHRPHLPRRIPDRRARTLVRCRDRSGRDGFLAQNHVRRAQPCRFAARQGQCRDGAGAVQAMGLGRAYRGVRRPLSGAHPYKLKLTEPAVPGDESSKFFKSGLPAYVAYQGDGDVTAPAVYVNYGMPADYDQLERMGISVKGKIVITRYGKGWRGLKPKLAQDHGAVGCIIYSDPRDDGYAVDDSYPNGPARPEGGLQRGSVQDMTLYPGDPLTPGIGATKNAKRLKVSEAPTILKIPTLPISWGEARHLLATLDGPTAPRAWMGNVPLTYRLGGGGAPIHLAVKSDWSLKPLYNVVATLK